MRRIRTGGFVLLDLVFAVALCVVLLGAAVPGMLAAASRLKARAAAKYVAARAESARSLAITSGRVTGLRFVSIDADLRFTVYVDGNGNGLRTTDIGQGLDAVVEGPFQISELFPGVGADLTPGRGVRFGAAGIASFTPYGTASSGTVYLQGAGGWQYAIRVLGATGRVRVLEWHSRAQEWRAAP